MNEFVIRNNTDRRRFINHIDSLPLGMPIKIVISENDRSVEQNDKLHALLGDIAKQVEHYGRKWSVPIWKRLCTAAWLRELGECPELIPAIDGNGVDIIYEKTSKLGIKKCASLITWVQAYGDQNDVKFKADESYDNYPESAQ